MISIITVTYNSRLEIERFLLSLTEMLKNFSVEVETKIWDNASSDGTGGYLQTLQSNQELRMTLHLSPKNVGFSKAANSEIERSKGEWILLCNPDVEFSDDVPRLLDFASFHQMYGVVPDLKNPDGTIQRSIHRRFPSFTRIFFEYTSLGRYSSRLLPFVRDDYKYSHTKFTTPTFIEQPGGAFLLLHRNLLVRLSKNAKLFDERFPIFWNDVDMSMRARTEGVKFVIVPEVRILHGFGRSVKKIDRVTRLTLLLGRHGLIGFAHKWRMHPRAIQTIFFLDSIFDVLLWFASKFFRRSSRDTASAEPEGSVSTLKWRIMKFWCSVH
jgi:GT2 family glycosyltransferase